ncbi:hypothetical protein [Aureimonas sp. AU4]|uniref:hypothetical protein n=1 Tax=Aureimonas sp. AU4 TaxID=1638163 RepID=UPI000705E0EF|nr:hypothetical protein [Aureimonas sp. AU4]BAT30644.1 short-chain dehydrogenase/reductase SDR [Aureimonas sp. AU4]
MQTQIHEDELGRVFAGRKYALLDILMRGGPPTDGTITIDFQPMVRQPAGRPRSIQGVQIHLLIARTGLPTLASLRILHTVMHPHERKWLDDSLAIHGDTDTACRLYESDHKKPDVWAAFAVGLRSHSYAMFRYSDWRWHAGVEFTISTDGVATRWERARRRHDVVMAVMDWRQVSGKPDPSESIEASRRD